MVESPQHTGNQVVCGAFSRWGACPRLWLGWGEVHQGGKEKPIHQGEEESPNPVSGEQIVLFHTRKRGITKELLPGGFAATLSLVVEEEMPPLFVAEEESMSLNARLRSVQVFS